MNRFLFYFVVCLFVGGCAFTRADLDVKYNPQKAKKGPLSSLPSIAINIYDLEDTRLDRGRIGYKINGLGMETADIVTKEPVTEILRSALVTLFEKNGHLAGKGDESLVIDGKIKQFWLELQVNMLTVEFMGTIVLVLNVKDEDGKVLYAREYQGHYDEKKAAGYSKSWERVMNVTLEKLIYQIATDKELIDVLKKQTS